MDTADITAILNRLGDGEPDTRSQAWEVLYPEMMRLAKAERRRWEGHWTLETRALVNEAYLKLFGEAPRNYADRRHFFRLTSRVIRQVLVTYARTQQAAKRGGADSVVALHEGEGVALPEATVEDVLSLHDALERLAELDPRAGEIVDLRFFAGLTHEEIGQTLGVSLATVGRDWVVAKAWLSRELADAGGSGGQVSLEG